MKLCVHELGFRAWLVGRGGEWRFYGRLYRLPWQKLHSCELLETEASCLHILCVLKHRGQSKASVFYLSHAVSLYNFAGMNYSTAGFELVLTRKMSFYIITYYLPSGLFVVVSWIR
jgi:hypothetical protein